MPFKLSKKETNEDYRKGENVVYIPVDKSPHAAVGQIEKILTAETRVQSASPRTGEVTIHASKEEPRYLIRNLNTDKSTAYKRYNIMGEASNDEVKSGHSDFSLDEDTSPHAEGPHHGVAIH